MGGIKPIGSERLEGMDKLRRIMEIARYKENIPQQVNETKSTEYSINLADGNVYRIEKERQGYIIKLAINESESEYIEPMKARRYYSAYSQALKRLNLITKEINALYENKEGTALIGEQKKKFVLKTKKKVESPPAQGADAGLPPVPGAEGDAGLPPVPGAEGDAGLPPVPGAEGDAGLPPVPGAEGDAGLPPVEGDAGLPPVEGDAGLPPVEGDAGLPPVPGVEGEEGGLPPVPGAEGELPPVEGEEEEMEFDAEEKPKEKKVSDLKRIQILVGKLAQKIRSYSEEKELSSQNVKYIVNSILSALDVDVLDEDDIESIISKLEGVEGDEEEEGEEIETEVEGELPEPPPAPEGELPEPPTEGEEEIPAPPEMGEGYDTLGGALRDYIPAAYGNLAMSKMSGEQVEEYDPDLEEIDFEDVKEDDYGSHRRKRHFYPDTETFSHGTFGESTVDKILSNYFSATPKEEVLHEVNYKKNKDSIIKLAETVNQLDQALAFIKKNPKTKLMGLSNKKNLIFKQGINEVKITVNGLIL